MACQPSSKAVPHENKAGDNDKVQGVCAICARGEVVMSIDFLGGEKGSGNACQGFIISSGKDGALQLQCSSQRALPTRRAQAGAGVRRPCGSLDV